MPKKYYNDPTRPEFQLATASEAATATDDERVISPAILGLFTGRRNLIINPNFAINQRAYATGAATTAANQYTLDRWRVVVSGQAVTWSDSGGVRTVTAPAGGMEQVIEGAGMPAGTYCISWTGTATCTIGGTSRANGEAFTLAGGSNVTVRFSGGTVALPQLERGGAKTPFDVRTYAEEALLCKRYYNKLTAGDVYTPFCAGAINTGYATGALSFPEMRAAPTITTNNLAVYVADSTLTGTVTPNQIGKASANIGIAVAATVGDACRIIANGTDGYIALSAEL